MFRLISKPVDQLLGQANGTAELVQGGKRVLATISGPTRSISGIDSKKTVRIQVLVKYCSKDGKSKAEYEQLIKKVVAGSIDEKKYLHSVVEVYVQELVGNDLLCLAINAVAASLIRSGIPLNHVPIAVDLRDEEKGASVLGVYESEKFSLVGVHTSGKINFSSLVKALEKMSERAEKRLGQIYQILSS